MILDLNEDNKARYRSLQEQLDSIIETEIQGVILRSLCDEYEQGEKCTKYFFSSEKYRAKQKTISRLKLGDGSFSSDANIILEECRKFYKKLYSRNLNVNHRLYPEFFNNVTIPKLSEKQKQLCESKLTVHITYAIIDDIK